MRASILAVFAGISALFGPALARADEPPRASRVANEDPTQIEFDVRTGFGVRAGSSPNFPISERIGGVFGLGIGVLPTKRFGVTLVWEHSSLGSEQSKGEVADVDLTRTLDVFWASMKIHAVETERFKLIAQIGPGLGLQHVSANVLLWNPVGRPTAYACRESAGPGFALRAGVGAEVWIGGPLSLTFDAQLDHVHMSSDMMGECVPGSGALSIPGMRLGFVYRLDVTRWTR